MMLVVGSTMHILCRWCDVQCTCTLYMNMYTTQQYIQILSYSKVKGGLTCPLVLTADITESLWRKATCLCALTLREPWEPQAVGAHAETVCVTDVAAVVAQDTTATSSGGRACPIQ